jgi:hypothetical protein
VVDKRMMDGMKMEEKREKKAGYKRGGQSVYEWFLEARGNLSIGTDKS